MGGCCSTPETGAAKFSLCKNVGLGTLGMALKELHFKKAFPQCQPGTALTCQPKMGLHMQQWDVAEPGICCH